jgi:4-aminobutyrate aminotransferase-like enzyme
MIETKKEKSKPVFKAGPKSTAIFELEQEHIAPGSQQIGSFSGLAMERGEGCYFIDADGNKYLDLYAGVGIASLGHSHKEYVKALQEQVSKIGIGSFTTKNRAEYVKKLAGVTPGDLNFTQFYSGGAETVEAAQKLAKSYTGNYEFVGFWGGFHGKTMGVLGLLGDTYKHNYGPLPAGIHLVPYAYCYRCPFKTTYPKCGLLCAEYIRDCVKLQTTNKVAAFIMEPIQGTNGNVVPPAGYVKAIAEIARENGALFIADEIITCLGRTGKMFACQYEDVVPDAVTMGKGVACGFPVSLLVSSEKIMNAKPFSNPSGSSSSFGGNPMAAAACNVVLDTIIKENLVENSRIMGKFMLSEFKKLQEKYSFIGDVRGRGLMIGVELVSDRKTKEPLPKDITKPLYYECLKRGVMSMCYSKTIRINPPLIITKAEAEEAVAKFDEAFAAISKRFGLN